MAKHTDDKTITLEITIVAVLMILFGLAEMATGFTHNFFGVLTASDIAATYGAVILGALYAISGLLILTMKKKAVTLAMAYLAVVIIGRVGMVLAGLYPTGTLLQNVAITIGTAIAIIFEIYIGLKWNEFG